MKKFLTLLLGIALFCGTSVFAKDVHFDGDTIYQAWGAFQETSTPVAKSGTGKVYTKEDNTLYFQDGAGTEHSVCTESGCTFTGAVSGTTGTFSGAVSGTTITGSSTVTGSGVVSTGAQITAGTGTGLTVNDAGSVRNQVYKVTLDYTGLSAAATTATHTIATLPAGVKIVGIIADTTAEYTGGSVSAATIEVGIDSGDTDAFLAAHDVFSGAVVVGDADADLGTLIIRANAVSGGYINWSGTTVISVLLTTTTDDTENLTQGSTTYYIETVQVK